MEAAGKEVFTAYRYTKTSLTSKIPTIQYAGGLATTFGEKCEAFLTTLFPIPPLEAQEA